MKTSRYFVIGYSVFILVVLLVMYALAGTQGVKREKQTHRGYSVEKELQPFSVVVADEGFNFALESGSKHKVILRSQTDSTLKVPNYKIANDTLFLTRETIIKGVRPLFIGKKFKAVIGKNNNKVYFENVKPEGTLMLELNSGRIWGTLSADNDSMIVKAKNSDVNIRNTKMTHLKADLSKTNLHVYGCTINTIEVTLKNHSRLSGRVHTKLILETDNTSGYSIHK